MNGEINLVSIYATNGVAILLAGMLLLGTNWRIRFRSDEYRTIKVMLIITIISCVVDPIVVTVDGRPGTFCRLANYLGNSWLYLGNVMIGPGALYIVTKHLGGSFPKGQKIFVGVFSSIGVLALLINIFYPVVYYIDENNIYSRQSLFFMYTVIEGAIILDVIVVYFHYKVRGGILKFFPVVPFVIPVAVGITAQTYVYGISVIWPSIVVSICGMLNGLRNEALFMDSLTGIYNRLYLDDIKRELQKKKNGQFMVMMLDLNDFKSINDKFGHAVGDEALINTAGILQQTVGSLGSVMRYAGDEFVIILNTIREDVAADCVNAIREKLEQFNETSGEPYRLSMAIGYALLDLKNETMDEAARKVDALMYDEKAEYYKNHSRRRSDNN